MAYCILDVPPKSPKESQLPILQSWHRLAVSSAPAKRNPSSETGDDEAVVPPTKEAFDPATLSTVAYTLLRKRLLTQIPTNVLIERQRFRSMGSKHILEWTIRVNMFESILYAVLHTLKAEGAWSGNVIPVTPGKVGPFWVGEDIAEEEGRLKGKQRTSKSSKIRNKGAKIDLVRKWLEGGEMVRFGNEDVEAMARAYREKWDRAPGGRKGVKRGEVSEEEKMGKLDDLADCLLQGMAWVQWEENKRFALKHGIDTLLDL